MTTEPTAPITDAPNTEFLPSGTPEPAETTMQAMKLGDEFDGALLGATIRGQFAYSLVILTEMAMERFALDEEQARGYVGHNVVLATRDCGDAAPVFVDDELVRGAPRRRGGLITTAVDAPRDILVPGQNHGGVKGFLAPNELGK